MFNLNRQNNRDRNAPEGVSDHDMDFGIDHETSYDDYDEFNDDIENIDPEELETLTRDQ